METGTLSHRPDACPDCGAAFPANGERCWLCGWKIGDPTSHRKKQITPPPVNPYASPAPPSNANLNRTFSLSTMFLWMTLVAVVMGVVSIAPGLGIGLAILSFPTALRTTMAAGRRSQKTGEPMAVSEKISVFANSLGLVIAIILGFVAAFMATCTAAAIGASPVLGRFENVVVLILVVGVSLAVASYAAYAIARPRWRRED